MFSLIEWYDKFMLSDLEFREVFHFCFLEHLLKISDPGLYILKGGVNLRFYFNSPRYSEDMDLDVIAGDVTTLKKNGYKILEDSSFKKKLKTFGIEDLELSDPAKAKHTKTTQRFKLRLIDISGNKLATKIEFSRREKTHSSYIHLTERVDVDVAGKYNRLAFLAQHYSASTAVLQKLEALAYRKQVEARDAFDIFIIYLGGHLSKSFSCKLVPDEVLERARNSLESICYKEYESKVLEFLSDDNRHEYDGELRWCEIKKTIRKIINS